MVEICENSGCKTQKYILNCLLVLLNCLWRSAGIHTNANKHCAAHTKMTF